MLALSKALQSSKAAIDLASIMVGVIIIGLIGGVIAATVFAVIPWSQDKAAKQQLESVHTAENAFFGLSSDPSTDLTNGKKNSFATSVELASAGLLVENSAVYCVASADANNYTAYVKSASGKIFKATNANKTPVVDTTGTDCFSVPPTTTPPTTNPPTGPVYSSVSSYDFETTRPALAIYSNSVVSYSTAMPRGGTTSVKADFNNINNVSWGAKINFPEMTPGSTYRVTAWMHTGNANVAKFGIVSNEANAVPTYTTPQTGQWTKVTAEFTAASGSIGFLATRASGNTNGVSIYIDDVTIEKVN